MRRKSISLSLALTLIFIVGLVTHLSMWHIPLFDLGALMTPEQDEKYTDPNYYLHVANSVCKLPNWTVEDITVTWSAVGVIGYLNYGCRFFGTEYFYIILNPLLVSLSLGLVVAVGRNIGLRTTITLPSVMLLPYTFLTLSLPGKELISLVGTLTMLGGLMLTSAHKRWFLGLLLIILGLFIVGLNRLHEAGVLAGFCILWLSGTLKSPLRLLFIVFLFSQIAGDLLQGVRLNQDAESLTDEILWSGSSEGKAVDLDAFFSILRSDNLFIHSLIGIFRVLVVLVSPLSSLITPLTETNWSYFIFRDISQRLRLIDFTFMIYIFFRIVKSWRRPVHTRVERDWLMMPLLFFFMVYVVSFFGVSQKSRYIFQYTPVLLLWFWFYAERITHMKNIKLKSCNVNKCVTRNG